MSLVDKINLNTSAVSNGKLSLQNAINANGGSVPETGTIPTFQELIDGVNDIFSVNKIIGSSVVSSLADTDIAKGTVCSLKNPPQGAFEAVNVCDIPITAKNGDTIVNLTGKPVKLDAQGKLLLRKASGDDYWYPFYFENNTYVQVTYEGEYVPLGNVTLSAPPQCYDIVSNNIMYAKNVGHIDFENKNIEFLTSASISPSGCLVAYNNNFILLQQSNSTYSLVRNVLYKYDADTNTLNTVGTIGLLTGIITGGSLVPDEYYSCYVSDWNVYGDFLYLSIVNFYYNPSSAEVYIAKFKYDNTSKQYVYQSKKRIATNCKPASPIYSNIYYNEVGKVPMNAIAQISLSATILMYIDKSTTLHYFTVNSDTLEVTEQTLSFSDNLDVTKISNIAMVRGTGFLYVKSTDTDTYSSEELIRLYKYAQGTGEYQFIGCPNLMFSPTASASMLPPHTNLVDGKTTLVQKADGAYSIYRVGYVTTDYDSIASVCNNFLVVNADNYGIALENISSGDIGKVQQILSGQQETFNDVAEASIGGAY